MTSAEPTQSPQHGQLQRVAAMAGKVVTTIVYAYVLAVEVILGLGFILLLFGANPSSGFVEWIYRSMDRAMKPFRGIFEPVELGVAGNDVPSILETSVLFAMIIYAVVALVLGSLLHWLTLRIHDIDSANRVRQVEQAHRDAELAYRQALLQAQGSTSTTQTTTRVTSSTPLHDPPTPT